MRWGGDQVGVVLTRNEIWLLLNALSAATVPAVDRDGNRLEPWVVGELKERLQTAMRPDPLSDVEERPIIRVDSDMGRSLAEAGVRTLVLEDGYDVGSLIAECAERGLGVELRLPVGSGPETPAEVVVGNWQRAMGNGEEAFVGLERPVVALARALLGAIHADRGQWAMGNGQLESVETTEREFEEHVIYNNAIAPGEKSRTIARMKDQGWEVVVDEGSGPESRVVFRRWAKGNRQ